MARKGSAGAVLDRLTPVPRAHPSPRWSGAPPRRDIATAYRLIGQPADPLPRWRQRRATGGTDGACRGGSQRQLPPRHWVAGAQARSLAAPASGSSVSTMHQALRRLPASGAGSVPTSDHHRRRPPWKPRWTARCRCCWTGESSAGTWPWCPKLRWSGLGSRTCRPPAHGQPGGGGGVKHLRPVMQDRIGQGCAANSSRWGPSRWRRFTAVTAIPGNFPGGTGTGS